MVVITTFRRLRAANCTLITGEFSCARTYIFILISFLAEQLAEKSQQLVSRVGTICAEREFGHAWRNRHLVSGKVNLRYATLLRTNVSAFTKTPGTNGRRNSARRDAQAAKCLSNDAFRHDRPLRVIRLRLR